jgi:hypothetical protein
VAEWHPLNLTVTAESHDGWASFCAAHGTTMTALAEAIGLVLGELDNPEAQLPPLLRQTLAESRRIAAERVSRRR